MNSVTQMLTAYINIREKSVISGWDVLSYAGLASGYLKLNNINDTLILVIFH